MKDMQIMWMFIFLVLPFAGLGYALWHVWQLLPLAVAWKWAVIGALTAAFAMMFVGFSGAIERLPLGAASAVYNTGNTAIFVLLYLVMLFLLLDAATLTRIMPRAWLHGNWYMTAGVTAIIAGIFIYGNIHYNDKYRKTLDIATEKTLTDNSQSIKVVMLSDLHLGYHNRRSEMARWVDMINAEHPDLILIGGDIIDISVRPLIEEGVAKEFRRFTAPVYACLGNHEYYAGEPRAQQFYKDAGITLLRDSVATTGNISIIGRDDRSNPRRRPLADLMKGIPTNRFTILLDHQPYRLDEAEKAGIDFQFSGHTHDGQVWPASWITRAMYEQSFGELQKGRTHYYVSSGMGIWGGKYRIGTRSEYVVATFRHK